MENTHTKNGFAHLIFAIIVAGLITTVAVVALNTYKAHGTATSLSGNPTTEEDFNAQNRDLVKQVAQSATIEAAAIHYPVSPISEVNENLGCKISGPSEIGQKTVVNCQYRHYSLYKGAGKPQAEVEALYGAVNKAGWNVWEAAGESRYASFLKDPSYFGAFPVGLKKSPDDNPYVSHSLDIDLVSKKDTAPGSNDEVYYRDQFKNQLIAPTDYVYGYSIAYTYYFQYCEKCKVPSGL